MKKSLHNLFVKVREDAWLLANPLSGHADLLTNAEAESFANGRLDTDYMKERGYVVAPDEEAAAYTAAYLRFLEERETDEVQIFYVPSYACNFDCDYCYQGEYRNTRAEHGAAIDAFFAYIDKTFADRRKYLTLFGGEPLLPGKGRRAVIADFLDQARKRSLETAIVTNGYHVTDYLDLIGSAAIREVQVTLDGLREAHNRRRPLKGGGDTFDRVVAGVDALLEADIPVNLRIVLDRENIRQLASLADFAAQRGWTGHPKFKTQLGRNYELHHCNHTPNALFSRLEMYRQVAAEIEAHPHILAFHQPAFHLARTLGEQGSLPSPNFDACPGAKTEWAFDYTGRIYSCTATVGKKEEALGTFYPTVRLDEEAVFEWQDRDVLAIEKCGSCNARLVCGGGCGALAKNKSGALHSPDCRPVEDITALGAPLYLEALKDSH